MHIKRPQRRELPDGPVVKNPPSNAGGVSLIPGQETKIPHIVPQPESPHAATREACTTTQSPHAAPKAQHGQNFTIFLKDHKGYVAILKPPHYFPPYFSWTEETTRIQKRLEPQDKGAQILGWPSRAGPPFYPLSLWHEWGMNFSYAKPLSSKEFCLPRLVH